MKVAVVVGVAAQHDAISAAALEQVAALQRAARRRRGRACSRRASTSTRDARASSRRNPWELLRHPEFRSCDVAIFHWGIHFALFDAITLLGSPQLPTPVVHFHNCTPPSLVEEIHRDQLLRSIQQFHHVIAMGTPLWTYSEFNRRTLIDWGAAEAQIEWVTFPIPVPQPTPGAPSRRLVPPAVGRSARAGQGRARAARCADVHPGCRCSSASGCRVVSSTTFSSDDYRDGVRRADPRGGTAAGEGGGVRRLALRRRARTCSTRTATSSSRPSFHEGLCVPVIEGYAAGCRAIGTTAGNLPYIVFPPDPVVAPGDPPALADAIERVLDRPRSQRPVVSTPGAGSWSTPSRRGRASAMLQRALIDVVDTPDVRGRSTRCQLKGCGRRRDHAAAAGTTTARPPGSLRLTT